MSPPRSEVETRREPSVAFETRREKAASAQTIGVHAKTPALPEQSMKPKVSVAKQASSASVVKPEDRQEKEGSGKSDLFGEANEDKRAEIPAFLRAQDKSSEADDSDRFEIPAFLRRQAGSGN